MKTTILMRNFKAELLGSLLIVFICFQSCSSNTHKLAQAKQAILKTEKDFETSVKNDGMAVAFEKFAAEDAVIHRNDKIIKGKKAIREFYEKNRKPDNTQLTWTADYVEVSKSCEMGFTYGKFLYSNIDSSTKKSEFKGIFHTVWVKQSGGEWKYVWD